MFCDSFVFRSMDIDRITVCCSKSRLQVRMFGKKRDDQMCDPNLPQHSAYIILRNMVDGDVVEGDIRTLFVQTRCCVRLIEKKPYHWRAVRLPSWSRRIYSMNRISIVITSFVNVWIWLYSGQPERWSSVSPHGDGKHKSNIQQQHTALASLYSRREPRAIHVTVMVKNSYTYF